MFIFFSVFLTGIISSFEFDNTKTFNETDRSLIVHNAFNLPLIGDDIAKITPLTPHVVKVIRGKNRTVAEFQIENYADNYSNVFKEMEFFNLRNNNISEDRQFFFQYESIIGTEEKPIYEEVCENLKSVNGTDYRSCSNIFLRNETVNITEWKDLDVSNSLPKRTYKIRIVTDVKPNEKIEFIPTWFGVRMPEYSVWTEDLNTDLVGYWKFDNNNLSDNVQNLTTTNTGTTNGTGIIISGRDFVGASSQKIDVNDNADLNFGTGAFSLNVWMNTSFTSQPSSGLMTKHREGSPFTGFTMRLTTGHLVNFVISGTGIITSTTAVNDSVWHMITWTRQSNGTNTLYIDGVSEGTPVTNTANLDFAIPMRFGQVAAFGDFYTGDMDEAAVWKNRSISVSIVEQLYNNGSAITWTNIFTPTVTLNSPVEDFNSSNQTIDFNGSVTSPKGVINVSLILDGILNETNSSGINDTDYFFTKTLLQGDHNWTYESCNSQGCANATTRNFTIDILVPVINLTFPENITFITEQTQLNFTVDAEGVRCWFSTDGGVTNSSDNDCTENFTGITSVLGSNTWIVFSNNSVGEVGQDNVTFTFSKFIENTPTFEAFVFETSTQSYTINITTNGTDDPSSATFFYAGVDKGSGTIISTSGNDFNISATIDIPLGSGNNSWFFNITTDGIEESSGSNQQEVSGINLTFCQASPQDVEYLNFSFKNETTSEEDINASIVSSSWQYFLGAGEINRTLSYSNSTEALNYAFCFSPPNQTVTTSLDLDFTNSISQQRKFNPSPLTLTNTTTQQTLFLLPTVDGIFVTFQVVDPAEQVISGVSSNVTKDGDIISSGTTDDAGLITYFLDPDTSYVFSFSKTGLTGVTTTLVPTQTSFTIIMGVVTTINQFDTTIGIDYTITPNNLTLVNGTDVNFSLDLVSTFNTLEEFGFVLRNSTGTIFNSTSSTTGTGGLLSQTLNTGSNTDITMEVFWTITGNQTNVTRIWLIFNLENEGFSVLTFFNDLSIYLTSGLFGLDDFGLGIIIFLIILVSTGIVSVKFGITSPPGISIVVFSLVAFFDVALGIMPNPINAIPNFPTIFVGLIFLGTLYSEAIR